MKLIVLDKVDQLRRRSEGVLDDLTMEILRVLSSPDLDVRKKALSIAMEMVSSKNVEEVVMLLKKELAKTVDEQYEKVAKAGGLQRLRANFHPEQRIPITTYSFNTSMCHQVLPDRVQRGGSSNGLYRRL